MLYNLLQNTDHWLDQFRLFDSVVQVMYQLEFRAFFAVVMSFAIVLCFGRRTIAWLIRKKVGDQPEFYNAEINKLMATKAATPTMGGILICASIFTTVVLLADMRNGYVHLALIVLCWLAVVGGFDDWLKLTTATRRPGSREGMHAWEKLLFQLGIGLVAGFFIYRHGAGNDAAHALVLPFQRTYVPNAEAAVLEEGVIILGLVPFLIIAMLFIAGSSNAVNLTDGMDGLASGTMLIASLAMMTLCYIAGDFQSAKFLMFPFVEDAGEMMVVTGAMAGACLGFLLVRCRVGQ